MSAAILTGDQLLLVAGLIGALRFVLDRSLVGVTGYRMLVAAAAAGIAGVHAAQQDSVVGALTTLPFVLIGAGTLAWLLIGATERASVRALALVAAAGLVVEVVATVI